MADSGSHGGREPVFGDVPPVVLWLGVAIVAVSVIVLIGPAPLANRIVATCALAIGRPAGAPPQPLGPYAPYLLHVFVHGGWAHLGLNMAGFAAFGVACARRLRSPLLFLAFFFLTSAAGAGAEALMPHGQPITMYGASTGVFGLVTGATYVRSARGGPLPSLLTREMLGGLAPWVAINLVIAVVGGAAFGYANIAWAAHLGGMAAGALAFPLFDRLANPQAA